MYKRSARKIPNSVKKALSVKVSFADGTIWLPESHLSIDEWLGSIAETDEELRELEIPRIQFLQNRWPSEELVEFEWDNAEARLKPMNGAKWTEIDDAIDKVLREIRAVHPNAATAKTALQNLLSALQ